ncbi:MAG: hypothetical protein K2G70_03090 [Turicibacter sp.]|nr:hypothetical protein [Turicibacter sp.]
MTKIDNKHINTIKRVVSAGYSDEKTILSLSAKQMVGFSKSLSEVNDVIELQDAIKENKLLDYIIKKENQY